MAHDIKISYASTNGKLKSFIMDLDLDEIWQRIAGEYHSTATQSQLHELKMQAASDYLFDANTDLRNLFEQYIIMKTLSNPHDKNI